MVVGDGGPNHLGTAIPFSMRPENDPVLSLLSRDAQSMGAEEMDMMMKKVRIKIMKIPAESCVPPKEPDDRRTPTTHSLDLL